LAIFADPHDLGGQFKNNPAAEKKAEEADRARTDRQANAFSREVPSAKVIRVPHASHIIYRSNEEFVLSAIDSFIQTLPR
jgi:hypothetical protein